MQLFYYEKKSAQQFLFELDDPFDKKYIDTEDPLQTMCMINLYLSHIRERLDCITSKDFLTFFQLDIQLKQGVKALQKQYVEQLVEVNIGSKQQKLIDVEWQAEQKILFIVSQCKKQKKIQKLFKLFVSNQIEVNGTLQMIKFSQATNTWIQIHTQKIQAEPLKLTWSSKSSLLVISTTIGIYIYVVGLGTQRPDINLIDFVELPGISSVVCDSLIGQIYVLSNGINYQGKSKLCSYSMKKEVTVQIPFKLVKARSMTFQKGSRRLFISLQQGIKIFKIANDSQKIMLENIKPLFTIISESCFDEMKLSSEQKPEYLFGYSKKGFITVYQIKPPQKQYLMSVLTNVQCPSNFTFIQKLWSKKIFCVNYNNHLVFISMKNQPIWVKKYQIQNDKVNKIIYDQQNQRLMLCGNNTLKICKVIL